MNANYTCNSTTEEPSVLIASHEEALYFVVSGSPIHNESREHRYLAGIHCHLTVHMASPGECYCLYYCDLMFVRKRSESSALQSTTPAVTTTLRNNIDLYPWIVPVDERTVHYVYTYKGIIIIRVVGSLSCAALCQIMYISYFARSSLRRMAGVHCRMFFVVCSPSDDT